MNYACKSKQEKSVRASELNVMINTMRSLVQMQIVLDLFYNCTSLGGEVEMDGKLGFGFNHMCIRRLLCFAF